MSGPESSLSSPLTIPMATSSSVAVVGGCVPTISTYTKKSEGGGGGLKRDKATIGASHPDARREISGSKDASRRRDLDTV